MPSLIVGRDTRLSSHEYLFITGGCRDFLILFFGSFCEVPVHFTYDLSGVTELLDMLTFYICFINEKVKYQHVKKFC